MKHKVTKIHIPKNWKINNKVVIITINNKINNKGNKLFFTINVNYVKNKLIVKISQDIKNLVK